jgi:hypothetical protein
VTELLVLVQKAYGNEAMNQLKVFSVLLDFEAEESL